MIRVEIVNDEGTKGYDIRNFSNPNKLGYEIAIEVTRADNAGEGMVISNEQFFNLIDKFYQDNF